jgi:hypothetical protein
MGKMVNWQKWSTAFAAVILAGCASTPEIPLSVKQIQDLKVTSVEVIYAPDAMIAWSDEEEAFAKSKGYTDPGSAVAAANEKNKPNYEQLVNSPESKQHQKDLLTPRLKTAFDKALSDKATGAQPVKVVVAVKQMSASSAAQCGVIGGARYIIGAASLVDPSGKTIATYDNLHGGAMCAGVINAGVLAAAMSASQGDPIDVMTENMATNFKKWLTPKAVPG